MKAVVIYWSKTQNTEKVAIAIREGLESGEAEVSLVRMEDAGEIDFFDYDLVCVGFPSYRWRPPDPADEFLLHKFGEYRKQGKIQLGSPRIPGKNVQIFVTYSGPHTGIREAVPAGLYAGQYFDHLGFNVLEPWYVVGEFHGSVPNSTEGSLGDIRGRPNQEDLQEIRENAKRLAEDL